MTGGQCQRPWNERTTSILDPLVCAMPRRLRLLLTALRAFKTFFPFAHTSNRGIAAYQYQQSTLLFDFQT
jgi:hypothetical protein